jgi:hypothetical protein
MITIQMIGLGIGRSGRRSRFFRHSLMVPHHCHFQSRFSALSHENLSRSSCRPSFVALCEETLTSGMSPMVVIAFERLPPAPDPGEFSSRPKQLWWR